ncbi:MAG: hypothetical protein JO202_00365 [Ktedonobacteraceae bacterium]|nr:hypothetical protein [Ktedonobacteraceae bacterium]
MSSGNHLHVPPSQGGTLVFDASAGVTSLAGFSQTDAAVASVLAVGRTHLSQRHAGHHAAHHHGHHTTHHRAPKHAAHRDSTLRVTGEHQPF